LTISACVLLIANFVYGLNFECTCAGIDPPPVMQGLVSLCCGGTGIDTPEGKSGPGSWNGKGICTFDLPNTKVTTNQASESFKACCLASSCRKEIHWWFVPGSLGLRNTYESWRWVS
ncbi:hypothetical protein IAQ61_007304, partial [Plenodomus lingam]